MIANKTAGMNSPLTKAITVAIVPMVIIIQGKGFITINFLLLIDL